LLKKAIHKSDSLHPFISANLKQYIKHLKHSLQTSVHRPLVRTMGPYSNRHSPSRRDCNHWRTCRVCGFVMGLEFWVDLGLVNCGFFVVVDWVFSGCVLALEFGGFF